MKRWIGFAFIIVAGLLAIVLSQRQKIATQVSLKSVLSLTADAEREISGVPANLDRMSDANEIRIGDALAQSYESRCKSDQEKGKAKQVEPTFSKWEPLFGVMRLASCHTASTMCPRLCL